MAASPFITAFRFAEEGYTHVTHSALAPNPGDYNLNHSVNDDDRQLWESTFGSTVDHRADGNRDLVVDAADYVLWRKMNGAGSAAIGEVPEPAGVALVAILGIAGSCPKRRNRRLNSRSKLA
jgi:hypothetical protein